MSEHDHEHDKSTYPIFSVNGKHLRAHGFAVVIDSKGEGLVFMRSETEGSGDGEEEPFVAVASVFRPDLAAAVEEVGGSNLLERLTTYSFAAETFAVLQMDAALAIFDPGLLAAIWETTCPECVRESNGPDDQGRKL